MSGRLPEQQIRLPLVGFSWLTMSFVHWPVPARQLEPLLPAGLEVDEYDGTGWVSFTPFMLANLRPMSVGILPTAEPGMSRLRRLADISTTLETNLRTYVRGPDGRDGLWFLTLDIGSAAMAAALRMAVGAPYHLARLHLEHDGTLATYSGARIVGSRSYRLQASTGGALAPDRLDDWLTGRWRAYTQHLGRLLVTPVHHEAWPLQQARVETLEQDLTDAVGLGQLGDPAVVHFSRGVRDVRVGVPRPVPRSGAAG